MVTGSQGGFWTLFFHNKMAAFLWNLFQSVHCLLTALKNVDLRPPKVKIQGRAVSVSQTKYVFDFFVVCPCRLFLNAARSFARNQRWSSFFRTLLTCGCNKNFPMNQTFNQVEWGANCFCFFGKHTIENIFLLAPSGALVVIKV